MIWRVLQTNTIPRVGVPLDSNFPISIISLFFWDRKKKKREERIMVQRNHTVFPTEPLNVLRTVK